MHLATQPRRHVRKRLLFLVIFVPLAIIISVLYIYEEMKTPWTEIKVAVARSPRVKVNLNNFDTASVAATTTSAHELISWTTLEEISAMRRESTTLSGKKDNHFSTGGQNKDVYLPALKDKSIRDQRDLIAYEMDGYNFSGGSYLTSVRKNSMSLFESLIMEKGGEPVRSVIFATWRSGSTFLGDLLNSHPGTFYHYEPLLHMEVKQVRTQDESADAMKVLTHLLSCNYTDIEDFNKWQIYVNQERNQQNKRIWRFCQKQRKICEDPSFISDMCKLFPFQCVKTVRLRLRLGKLLLENNRFRNVRILLLVRDPRGIMQSRKHREWCYRGGDCIQPEMLCKDMEEDFQYAKMLRHQYPDRFLSLRYEDISLHPFPAAKKIFKFFKLQFHPSVSYFLQTHTVKNHGGVTSTYRDSKQTPFHWKRELYEEESDTVLETVQASCRKAMQNWGYALASNISQLLLFNPLRKPPWPEMRIGK